MFYRPEEIAKVTTNPTTSGVWIYQHVAATGSTWLQIMLDFVAGTT
jgi:hypothetical protein